MYEDFVSLDITVEDGIFLEDDSGYYINLSSAFNHAFGVVNNFLRFYYSDDLKKDNSSLGELVSDMNYLEIIIENSRGICNVFPFLKSEISFYKFKHDFSGYADIIFRHLPKNKNSGFESPLVINDCEDELQKYLLSMSKIFFRADMIEAGTYCSKMLDDIKKNCILFFEDCKDDYKRVLTSLSTVKCRSLLEFFKVNEKDEYKVSKKQDFNYI